MNLRLLLGGMKSYLPVQLSKYKGTGGTTTGSYCYSVWLRHMGIIGRHVPGFQPKNMVELGPGDSIGLGLAALLTGTDRYIGLDVLEHASRETNLKILDELVALLSKKADAADEKSFPRLYPRLKDYSYPHGVFNDATVSERLKPAYVEALRAELQGTLKGPKINYVCPYGSDSVAPGSADLVISQVTLQDMDHTRARDDLTRNLEVMARWLKAGGVMSHQIDFSCPGGAVWNHHWAFSDLEWTIIRGKRPYYVNRAPLSEYHRLFNSLGFDIVGVEPVTRAGLTRGQVAQRFKDLPDDDFQTAAALFVAVKR